MTLKSPHRRSQTPKTNIPNVLAVLIASLLLFIESSPYTQCLKSIMNYFYDFRTCSLFLNAMPKGLRLILLIITFSTTLYFDAEDNVFQWGDNCEPSPQSPRFLETCS